MNTGECIKSLENYLLRIEGQHCLSVYLFACVGRYECAILTFDLVYSICSKVAFLKNTDN